jgi:hypothetical protein
MPFYDIFGSGTYYGDNSLAGIKGGARVLYDGNLIIPAILLTYSRNFNSLPNGEVIGQTYNVNFSSTILPNMGSPYGSGWFWTDLENLPPDDFVSQDGNFEAILNKQRALRRIFNSDNLGKKFEVIPASGQSMYFYPTDVEISFSDSTNWSTKCEYTVSMVTDRIYPDVDSSGVYKISSASETWSIEPQEQSLGYNIPFTYRVSHNVSAVGQKSYFNSSGNIPFQEAKSWVSTRTGLNNSIMSGYNNLSGLGAYNHILTENIDELGGSYSIAETWTFSSGNVIEDFSISSQAGLDGFTNVNVDGNITGLESRVLNVIGNGVYSPSASGYKWNNASGYFENVKAQLHNRAQTFGGISLNPIPLSTTIGKNPRQGTISYSYQFNNRHSGYISGALSERISVDYNQKNTKIASIPVIGRPQGPVLQNLGTSDAREKFLSIDFVLGPSISPNFTSSDYNFPIHLISGIVASLDPINNGATKSFMTQPRESWEPATGSASYTVSWIWES